VCVGGREGSRSESILKRRGWVKVAFLDLVPLGRQVDGHGSGVFDLVFVLHICSRESEAEDRTETKMAHVGYLAETVCVVGSEPVLLFSFVGNFS
jgi:hypothetical protein